MSIDSVAHGTHGGGDGFSYQAVGRHLELRSRAIRNGNDGSQVSNGSSSHGATVIRLSGYYGDSDGPNVADVFDSRSFNAGSVMETSRATAAVQAVNVAVDSAASSTSAWLLECHLGGSSISADLRPIDLPDRIYVRATPYRSTSGAGAVMTW